MASLKNYINQPYKEPTASVKLDGNRMRDVVSIECSSSINDTLATITLNLLSKPSIKPEGKIQISQGYNTKNQLTFTGYADRIDYNEEDNVWVVTGRDVLKKAMDTYLIQEIKFGIDPALGTYYYSTYSSEEGGTFHVHEYGSLSALNASHPETTGNYTTEGVFAHAVVQWMLHMCGFAEGSEIQVENSNFFIGDLAPAKFHLTSIYDAILQIGNLIGWYVYADTAGIVRFRKRPRNPSAYVAWKYTSRTSDNNLLKISKSETNTDLRNYVEVRGTSGIRTVIRGNSPYIGNTPYRGVLVSDELIDTPGIASYMAKRIYNDLNRLKVAVNIDVDGNPYVQPGTTIQITAKEANGKYLVESVQSAQNAEEGYRMTATCTQYPGDPSEDDEPPPTIQALFTAVSAVIVGDPTYLIELDGVSSYSTRGEIINYTWDMPDGTRKSSDESTVWTAIKDVQLDAGVNIVLTVQDEAGQVGTTTSGINTEWLMSGLTPKYRTLYGALTTRAVGSLDGGNVWTAQPILAISVAASNFGPGGTYVSSGHALFGTSDGQIYRTVDGCATISGVYTTGNPVTSMHVPELNSTYALAGCMDGGLYQSVDAGVSWHKLHDFPFALRDIRYAYTDFNYILVVGAGLNNIYESYDGGAHFIQRSFGIDATEESSGAFTNHFAHASGVVAISGGVAVPMPFAGGATPYIPAATTMIDRDDGLMIVDDTGQHYVYESGIFRATQNNAANLTRYMIRDGEIPIIGYYATQSGISKSLDRNETIAELYYPTDGTMPDTGWGRMVAYGPLTSPITPGRIVIWGNMPADGAVLGMDGEVIHDNSRGGYFVSTTGNQWIYTVDYEEAYPQYATVTPGHLAYLHHANVIGKISITASGWPTIDKYHYDMHDIDPFPRVFNLSFSKLPGYYGQVHVLWIHLQDIFAEQSYPRWGTVTNFLASGVKFYEGKGSDTTIFSNGTNAGQAATRSALNDTIVIEAHAGTLHYETYQAHINLIDGSHIGKFISGTEGPTAKWSINPNEAKFANYWYTFAKYNADWHDGGSSWSDEYQLLASWDTEGGEEVPALNGRDTWVAKDTYASFQFRDTVYYAPSGIMRADKYGAGEPELIFTPPIGSVVLNFSVTPGPGLRSDCIAAIVASRHSDPTRWYEGKTYVSTDSGETWIPGPTLPEYGLAQGMNISSIWYVAEAAVG